MEPDGLPQTFEEKLQTIVTELRLNSTFSPDAVAKVAALVKDYEEVKQELKDRKQDYKNLKTEFDSLEKEYGVLIGERTSLVEREENVTAREKNMLELELKATNAELRRSDAMAIVGMVFKSPVYRESHLKNTPYKDNSGYMNTHCDTDIIEKTEE